MCYQERKSRRFVRRGELVVHRAGALAGLLLTGLLATGCGRPAPAPTDVEVRNVTTATEPGEWRHLSTDDIEVDFAAFLPIRARYLQVMYDLEGREEVQLSSIVHLDIDRAVHSGSWDGQVPIAIEPLQEPGLVVTWLIQNALWNGFDRVLTDRRLSMKERIMPGMSGPLLGSVKGDEVTRIDVIREQTDDPMPTQRETLPDGSVNVLTVPYALAAMDLAAGDRFTLPGYAMIGGPGGVGMPWRGAYEVISVGTREVKGREIRVAEVLFHRMDATNELTVEKIDRSSPGHRTTRLLISSDPPYLLGRANLMMGEDGNYRFVREFLGLVDWAEQPLPLSDYADPADWNLDLEAGSMRLDSGHTPPVLVPLNP